MKKKKNVPHKKGSNIIMIPFKSVGEEDVINKNISINGYDVIEKKLTKNKKILLIEVLRIILWRSMEKQN